MMGRRVVGLLLVIGFAISLVWSSSTTAQTDDLELRLQTQMISGTAFLADEDRSDGRGSGVASDTRLVSETPPTPAPAAFNYVMLRWQATATEETQVVLALRVSEDGQSWSEWDDVHHNEDLIDPSDPAGVYWSNTIYAGLSRFWHMRVTLTRGADGSMPVLHDVRVNTIDSRGPDPAAVTAPVPDGARVAGTVGMPTYIPRDAWGF